MSSMGTLAWLHISDLQFRASKTHDKSNLLQALLRDIKACTRAEGLQFDMKLDFIAVTGDVAFSGKKVEYDLARRFFDELLEITHLDRNRLFLVPGNHDVDTHKISAGARSVGESLTDAERVIDVLSSEADRKLLFRRFDSYAAFTNDYLHKHQRFDNEHFFYVRMLDIAGTRVAVLGLNSVWLSLGDDADHGKLVLGEQRVRTALDQSETADVRIALMHHPFDWLRKFDRMECEPLLRKNCDFILQGQLHRTDLTLQRLKSEATIIAASTGPESSEHARTYNYVMLDRSKVEARVFLRTYSDREGGFWTKDLLTYRDANDGVYSFRIRQGQEAKTSISLVPDSVTSLIGLTGPVYLKKLRLINFRCFKKETFSLSQEFTIFIGDNASGKTAVLEALAVAVGAFLQGIDEVGAPSIEPDQLRLVHYKHGETSTYEPQYPVRVSCEGTWLTREVSWTCASEGKSEQATESDANHMADLAMNLQKRVREGLEVVLPVIAYYSTGRLWRISEKESDDLHKPGSRFRGYQNCLDPASNVSDLIKWIKTQELIILKEKRSNRILEAIKEAIRHCVRNVQTVYYNIREDDLYVCFSDEKELPFRMLSEGVRNMLAMVADITYRAALLNPQFAETAAQETPGIVLIDEIDLHLHPKWQRRIVEDLRCTFPKMQFIATTHSPFVVQSLLPGELVDLQKGPKGEYVNRSIEDIVEEVMGITLPQRSQRHQEMYNAAQEYYRVLQRAKKASPQRKKALKKKLDELIAPFSDNVAYHAFLEMERTAAGLGEDDNETS